MKAIQLGRNLPKKGAACNMKMMQNFDISF